MVPNSGGRYALHYHAEQVPHPDSRVTLSKEVDAYGVPRAVIDLKFLEQDVDSVVRSHKLLDEALRANQLGRLDLWYQGEELNAKIWSQAADGFHQVGTTRMGEDPRSNVLDRNLQAHGVDNLYIAS